MPLEDHVFRMDHRIRDLLCNLRAPDSMTATMDIYRHRNGPKNRPYRLTKP